jgi:FkbM family methyltransferase
MKNLSLVNKIRNLLPDWLEEILRKIYNRSLVLRVQHFDPYIKKKNVEGCKFDFLIADPDGRDWYDLHCTDPVWPEMAFIRDHLIKKGDIVFDCGAHQGCTTIVLANWVGEEGKVISFEPVPKNCEIIKKNIQLNNLTNVILEEKAVGAGIGKVIINGASNSRIISSTKGVEVSLTNLDEYRHFKPSLLKIDVEGFEVEVLKGAKNILSSIPKLAIEIHANALTRFGYQVEDLFNLIAVDQYTFWVQWNSGEQPKEYDIKTSPPIRQTIHLFGIPQMVQ